MDSFTKSILIQVAFKQATASQRLGEEFTNADLMRETDDFFQVLVALHEKYDAGERDNKRTNTGGGGQRQSTSGGGKSEYTIVKEQQPTVTIDGEEYRDLRSAKEMGLLGTGNVPEFERVSDGRGFWLEKKDGSPTVMAQKVAAAGV